MTGKDKVFSWIAHDDELGRNEGGEPPSAGDEAHQLQNYQRKIDALESHVAALLDEVKKWREKAEDGEAKALEHQRRLDEVKRESMKSREEQGHIQEALQKAQLELAWLESELKSVKGEK